MTDEKVRCYRCGEVAYVEWVDVTRFGDAEPRAILSRTLCETPGCIDEIGRRQALAPPTAEELRDHADRQWFAYHMRLVSER